MSVYLILIISLWGIAVVFAGGLLLVWVLWLFGWFIRVVNNAYLMLKGDIAHRKWVLTPFEDDSETPTPFEEN